MTIPNDLRQFSVGAMMTATVTFALSSVFYKIATVRPALFFVFISFFWIGMGLFVLSDNLDPSSPNSKGTFSHILNSAGLILTAIGFIGWFGLLTINLVQLMSEWFA
ncbi:MAG: hypothetical protein AAF483_06745 [Planctomycetota bacterium]